MPCDAPVKTMPTSPVGAMSTSSRIRTRGETRTGGASVVAASAIGTNDIETRMEAAMNSPLPSTSPAPISSCPTPMPPIEAIM